MSGVPTYYANELKRGDIPTRCARCGGNVLATDAIDGDVIYSCLACSDEVAVVRTVERPVRVLSLEPDYDGLCVLGCGRQTKPRTRSRLCEQHLDERARAVKREAAMKNRRGR